MLTRSSTFLDPLERPKNFIDNIGYERTADFGSPFFEVLKMNEKLKEQICRAEETFWENPSLLPYGEAREKLRFQQKDIKEAADRLKRFAPLILKLFPETEKEKGMIESPLREIEATREEIHHRIGIQSVGAERLLLKCDSHLAIAGSVKARGGIYEVLKHTEEIAFQNNFLKPGDDYAKLEQYKSFFSDYTIQVGSTGNLGMSIGIMSAALGYHAVVHMSMDAKNWKKQLLRSKGVIVREYQTDYSKAVEEGRRQSDRDPKSYFIDDEHSADLYLGYAVAGERLMKQLASMDIEVSAENPLYVYLPCGVGGAPGGITFGLKECFGDHVHCYFVEPTQAPCMLVGLASGEGENACVQDYGLTGKTEADGLAVPRPSGLVAKEMCHLVSGEATVSDSKLYDYMRLLKEKEDFIIEPSACAAFEGYCRLLKEKGTQKGTHILWATGGSLMPNDVIQEYLRK